MKLLGAIDGDADVVNKKYVDDKGTTIESAWYCTCSTAASTSAKVLTCSENDFTLKIGVIISVAFDHNNTASSVTLNVNSSGATPIGNRGSQYTGTDPEITGYEGRLLYYVYDGTYWNWLNVFAEEDKGGVPTGIMMLYAGSIPPSGWLICDGSAVSRTTYASLFNIIGTTYGSGDGSTTFNLPNFKGRVVVGLDANDSSFDTLGETGGTKDVTLNTNQIPKHTHSFTTGTESADHTHSIPSLSGTAAWVGDHTHGIPETYYARMQGSGGSFTGAYNDPYNKSTGAAGGHSHSVTTNASTTGGISANHTHSGTTDNQVSSELAHNNLQPYAVSNYIIKY